MKIGTTRQPINVSDKLSDWKLEQSQTSGLFQIITEGSGYIETAHILASPSEHRWSHQDLRNASGSVKPLYQQILHPKVDGIEISLGWQNAPMLPEYWHLNRVGSLYSCGLLREDYESPSFNSGDGHPSKALWVDLAISRVARDLLDSAAIYEGLGIPPDEPYLCSIAHGGLSGRVIYASSLKHLYFVTLQAASQEDVHEWRGELTQDLVRVNLVELTQEIVNSLVVLFDFTDVPGDVVAEAIKEYLRFRTRVKGR